MMMIRWEKPSGVMLETNDNPANVEHATRDSGGTVYTTDDRIQSLSGAGAVDIISRVTHVTSAAAIALTLADGHEGQRKTIRMIVEAGIATLTPTSVQGYATIAFKAVGDTVELLFSAGEWVITGIWGAVADDIQSLTGAGAANITQKYTEHTSTSTDAVTLADGAPGQIKVITLIVDGGDMTLTPATAMGYTTIVFADAGDSVTLMFTTLGWAIIGQGGLTTGPLSA